MYFGFSRGSVHCSEPSPGILRSRPLLLVILDRRAVRPQEVKLDPRPVSLSVRSFDGLLGPKKGTTDKNWDCVRRRPQLAARVQMNIYHRVAKSKKKTWASERESS